MSITAAAGPWAGGALYGCKTIDSEKRAMSKTAAASRREGWEALMIRAIYPGSFGPVTLGHLDIIRRAAGVVDELVVGVLINKSKKPLFSIEERVSMLRECTAGLKNVRVLSFDGLTVEFARSQDARIIVRGLRAVTDFEVEMQIAQNNRIVDHNIETMFLTTGLQYAYLSSTIVKEMASYGAEVSNFVTPDVAEALAKKFAPKAPKGQLFAGACPPRGQKQA